MQRAICWELSNAHNQTVAGLRIFVADRYVGTQDLSGANQRPIWNIEPLPNGASAAQRALAINDTEVERGAKLLVEPGEIMLHEDEIAALGLGGTIPVALRARIFTSLSRRRAQA